MRCVFDIKLYLIFIIPFALYSQRPQTGVAQLLAQVHLEIENDNFENAENILKKEMDHSDNKPILWMELGKIKVLQNEWHDARDWFDKVEKAGPENIYAQYYLGMCNREIGKFQATLFRVLSFKASQQYFARVIEKDSTFQDVFYQYALLDHLRKDY
jgi:tetratricopeptide (TPR) repeat protein